MQLYSGFTHVLLSNVGLYFCKTSRFYFNVTFRAGHISLTWFYLFREFGMTRDRLHSASVLRFKRRIIINETSNTHG